MQEVEGPAVDLGAELRVLVHPRLVGTPVELGAPAVDHRLQVGGGRALGPAGARPLGGEAGAGQAVLEVVQRILRDVDGEGLDRAGAVFVMSARYAQFRCKTFRNRRRAASLLRCSATCRASRCGSGPDLVGLLGVTDRTPRKDIERLARWAIRSMRRLAPAAATGWAGTALPPLLLSDDEAVAVADRARERRRRPGLADASAAAMAKLERTLPDRLQRRVRAIHASTEAGPANTGTNEPETPVDPDLLAQLAAAISARDGVRFSYDGAERPVTVDPYRLVSWRQRWYLVAREHPGREWRVFRVDWMRLRFPGGTRSRPLRSKAATTPRSSCDVASTGWKVHARILVDAPAQDVLDRINPAVGVVETVDDGHCVLVTGADTLETVAVWIGMLGIDFHVSEPPEARRAPAGPRAALQAVGAMRPGVIAPGLGTSSTGSGGAQRERGRLAVGARAQRVGLGDRLLERDRDLLVGASGRSTS